MAASTSRLHSAVMHSPATITDFHDNASETASFEDAHDGKAVGNGHEEIHGPHDDKVSQRHLVSLSLSWLLFGTVTWIMFFFYHSQSSDPDIRKATWETLSDMISILCAVLL